MRKEFKVAPSARRFFMKIGVAPTAKLISVLLTALLACDKAPRLNSITEPKPEPSAVFPERIVFVSDKETVLRRQIYTMKLDGSDRIRITRDQNDYVNPVFSPDGTAILATSYTSNFSNEIYAMNTDGSGLRNLSNSAGDDDCATYSPDGSRIVFVSTRDGNSEVYMMGADGNNQTRLTFSDLTDHSPRFTPDGSRILYCSTEVNPPGTYSYDTDIYVMNVDGSNKIRLTGEGSCHFYAPFLGRDSWFSQSNIYPGISSDGSKVLFSSYDAKQDNNWVLIMDIDGKNRRVVYAADLICAPLFAPGDSMIVFQSHRGGKFDLYEMALDGSKQRKLTQGTPGHTCFSQFSSNGSRILFTTDIGNYMSGNYQTIWIMNRNGSDQTQLTFLGENDEFPHFQPIRK